MKICKRIGKRRAMFCGVAVMALPLLLGFKVEGTETSGTGTPAVEETQSTDAQTHPGGTRIGEIVEKGRIPLFDAPPPVEDTPPLEELSSGEDDSEETRTLESDSQIRDYLSQFQGKPIVDIFYEGASDATLPTVKVAVMSRVGDDFDADISMMDREAIRNTGYFYEVYQTVSEVPEGIMLTYHMMENPVLKEISITGNTVYPMRELNRLVTVRRGTILNSRTLHDNMAEIQEKYHEDGYIRMKIADMNVSEDGVLSLKINEGTLEGYAVKGNTKTKDYVILREMRQKVGEPFNAKLARRSMERVYNLGFFEDVNVKMNDGVEPNAVIMEVEVQEKRTGTFAIGAGYSTKEGLIGLISIGDKNFRGTGDSISVSYETSADDTDAQGFIIMYRRPWLDRHETAGTIRLYNRTYEYSDYDTDGNLKERYMRKYVGGEISVSRPVSEYSTNQITLRQRKDKYVRHVSSGNAGDRSGIAYEDWRNANFGTTRSIDLQHITDTRDNIFNPTRGGRIVLDAEFGGLLGGDFKFQKISIDHQQYFQAGDHSQVWALRGSYGIGHGDMTEFSMFRLGGQNSLRGYRDDQFRGNRMFSATLEYRFPLASKVQGIIFTDWGSAWSSGFFPKTQNVYGSVGVGIALNTPLGPLRLDYGRGDQGGRFHFNVGGTF